MHQLRVRLDQPDHAVAIVCTNRRGQGLSKRVCFNALLQLGPMGEAIFASDDKLSIAKTKGTSYESRIVRLRKPWMPATYAIERVALTFTPLVEKFPRLALWDIEVRLLR